MNGFRWVFLFWLMGGLSGAEHSPTIETPEIEEDYFYIQHLIYYPEENNTIIIYKI